MNNQPKDYPVREDVEVTDNGNKVSIYVKRAGEKPQITHMTRSNFKQLAQAAGRMK